MSLVHRNGISLIETVDMELMKLLWNCALAAGGIGSVALGLLYFLQEKIIYIPRVPGMPDNYAYYPDYFGMDYEDVWITTPDGVQLHAWLMWQGHWTREQRAKRPVVIFFQENAGNMSFRLPFLRSVSRFLDCNTFIVSYRGYGKSQGSPSEKGLKIDAQTALDHILARSDVNTSKVILMGRSLGAAVAIHTAASNADSITGLIIENTFYNITTVVPDVLPLLGFVIGPGKPFNFMIRNLWWNDRELSRLKDMPTLFLSASEDEMIPASHMRKLYDIHGKEPWILVPFPGARHIDAYETHATTYWPVIKEFLAKLNEKKPLKAAAKESVAEAVAAPPEELRKQRAEFLNKIENTASRSEAAASKKDE